MAYKEVDFAYNALGQFTTVGDYNYNGGPRTDVATGTYSYDTANRLTGLTYTANGGATHIDAFAWAFDAADLVTSLTTNAGTASYGYDVTNQITSATYTGANQPANESYSFDKNGNRSMTGYSTGLNNLMTSDGTFNYQHDADGNQTVRTRISNSYATDYKTTYSWDYRNRLTDVEYYDNNGLLTKHVHYIFDVFDHLLATETDTTGGGSYNQIERYVLDVSPEIPRAGVPGVALAQPALEFDGDNNLKIRYLAAVDRIFAEGAVPSLTQADTTTWGLVDNLGSERYVIGNSSNVEDELVYNSFGVISYESNPSVHHFTGFAGGHADPNTGLVNDYERWYQASDAKWLSNDPTGFRAGDTNLSRYGFNDATDRIDRTGEHPALIALVAVVYYLWPDTANAPAPEDPTYASDPYEGMPGAIVAGLLSQAALLAAAKMAQHWAAATAAKAAAIAAEPVLVQAPAAGAATVTLNGLAAWIAQLQANIAAVTAMAAEAAAVGNAQVQQFLLNAAANMQAELSYAEAIYDSMITGY